jgi:hypothetical protein
MNYFPLTCEIVNMVNVCHLTFTLTWFEFLEAYIPLPDIWVSKFYIYPYLADILESIYLPNTALQHLPELQLNDRPTTCIITYNLTLG